MKVHPTQPLHVVDGVVRFRGNAIVQHLLRIGAIDLNKIDVGLFSKEDVEQFWQLLGYSVSGYGELSFIRRKTVEEIDREAEALLAAK